MFILFDTDVLQELMERETLEIGKEILEESAVSFAEHPYVKGKFMGFDVDLVPAYNVETGSGKMTAVDRTPFHTQFIVENSDTDIREEIRKLKAFAKGIGVYSADAKVKGFSGYLLELLVIKYGTFENVLTVAV